MVGNLNYIFIYLLIHYLLTYLTHTQLCVQFYIYFDFWYNFMGYIIFLLLYFALSKNTSQKFQKYITFCSTQFCNVTIKFPRSVMVSTMRKGHCFLFYIQYEKWMFLNKLYKFLVWTHIIKYHPDRHKCVF